MSVHFWRLGVLVSGSGALRVQEEGLIIMLHVQCIMTSQHILPYLDTKVLDSPQH